MFLCVKKTEMNGDFIFFPSMSRLLFVILRIQIASGSLMWRFPLHSLYYNRLPDKTACCDG